MNTKETSFCTKVLETTPTVIYIDDMVRNENIYLNQTAKDYLGYSQDEMWDMGEHLYDLIIHPDDVVSVLRGQQLLKTFADQERLKVKFRVKNKNGIYKWFAGYEAVFKRDENNVPIQKIGNVIDISDQEQRAAELAAIIETSPFAYFILDNRGTYLKGYPEESWYHFNLKSLGKTVEDVWSGTCPELVDEFYQKLPEILRSDIKEYFSITYTMNHPDDNQIYFFEAIITRIDENRILVTVRDVTDTKRILDVKLGINSLKIELQNLEKSKT